MDQVRLEEWWKAVMAGSLILSWWPRTLIVKRQLTELCMSKAECSQR